MHVDPNHTVNEAEARKVAYGRQVLLLGDDLQKYMGRWRSVAASFESDDEMAGLKNNNSAPHRRDRRSERDRTPHHA